MAVLEAVLLSMFCLCDAGLVLDSNYDKASCDGSMKIVIECLSQSEDRQTNEIVQSRNHFCRRHCSHDINEILPKRKGRIDKIIDWFESETGTSLQRLIQVLSVGGLASLIITIEVTFQIPWPTRVCQLMSLMFFIHILKPIVNIINSRL